MKAFLYLPVVISVQALISRTTPFGDCSFVVSVIVISTLETSLLDGICVKSTVDGLLLSSFGLDEDGIGRSLILFPSGA